MIFVGWDVKFRKWELPPMINVILKCACWNCKNTLLGKIGALFLLL
jgi:hypothetical protein